MLLRFVTGSLCDAALVGLRQAFETAGLAPEEAAKNYKTADFVLQGAKAAACEESPPRVENGKPSPLRRAAPGHEAIARTVPVQNEDRPCLDRNETRAVKALSSSASLARKCLWGYRLESFRDTLRSPAPLAPKRTRSSSLTLLASSDPRNQQTERRSNDVKKRSETACVRN